MGNYLIRRSFQMFIVLFFSALVTYALLNIAPGGPLTGLRQQIATGTRDVSEDDIARIPIQEELLVLVVEHPQNPGNLGTLIRSADAMGGHGVIVVEPAVDIYEPKTVRATMGSLFALPVLRIEIHQRLQDWLDQVRIELGRIQIVAASPHALTRIDQHDFTLPTLLIIGNEQTGISEHFERMCDALVSIPMSGSADSLNSAVSASIVLYEVNRQRLTRSTGAHSEKQV